MSTKKKTQVQLALIELRRRLGMTQQGLSEALHVTMVSVCRWETSRPPAGLSLIRLAKYARDAGLNDVAVIFEEELSGTVALWDIGAFDSVEFPMATLMRLTRELNERTPESIDLQFLAGYIKLLQDAIRLCSLGIKKTGSGPAEVERKWVLTEQRLKRVLEDAKNKAAQER
jgi:transcriptional regulator with XRE-family HTH domain